MSRLDALMARGADFLKAHPGFLDAEIAKGKGADVSVMLYTSGTTGRSEEHTSELQSH